MKLCNIIRASLKTAQKATLASWKHVHQVLPGVIGGVVATCSEALASILEILASYLLSS